MFRQTHIDEENLANIHKLKGYIEDKGDYDTIVANAALPTVDFTLRRMRDDGGLEYSLITRVKGRWLNVRWIFGGELKQNEVVDDTLARLARREVGLEMAEALAVESCGYINLYNPPSENDAGPLPACHTIMLLHLVDVVTDFVPRLDKTSKDFDWYKTGTYPPTLVKPMQVALKMLGLIS